MWLFNYVEQIYKAKMDRDLLFDENVFLYDLPRLLELTQEEHVSLFSKTYNKNINYEDVIVKLARKAEKTDLERSRLCRKMSSRYIQY